MRNTLIGALLSILFFASACSDKQQDNSGKVLAKVADRELKMTDLEGMFPEGTSKSDSLTIITAFVNRWVKDNLVMQEAEKNIPADVNIDKLVREYRSSLVLNTYQQKLMSNGLDTAVSEQELHNFYETNKSLYSLETPIMRCLLVKLPKGAPNLKEFEKWWDDGRKEDKNKIFNYANQYADVSLLIDSTWHRAERIAVELPKGMVNMEDLSTGEYTRKDDNYLYFLKILKVKNKKDEAPFEFVKDQASKFILHQRKQKLIEDKREELYKRELAANNVKIY